MNVAAPGAVHAQLAQSVREHASRVTAALVRVTGDFTTAEDLVQDAIETALRRWPAEGIPDRPDAWLYTVARNRGLDKLRRDSNYRAKLRLFTPPLAQPDDRLRLIFTCCHPSLAREAQVALTLRVVCGLTTAQVASAFLVPETTVAQRISRAKRKIAAAGIPYRVPGPDELASRLEAVLAVVYLLFNEGYLASVGRAASQELSDDAEWVAALLHTLMPTEPEVTGLLALIRLHRARRRGRFGLENELVVLADQDRSRWDRSAIEEATGLIAQAAKQKRPGPYQLQAAIVACHAEAPTFEETDWEQIVVLYDMLLCLAPSPVTRLHRAIALRYSGAPEAALAEVDALSGPLERYYLFHAARAELLRAAGRGTEARLADQRALQLTRNPAERDLLQRRLS